MQPINKRNKMPNELFNEIAKNFFNSIADENDSNEKTFEELTKVFSLYNDKVKKNSVIEHNTQTKQTYLIHISKSIIDKFVPIISKKAAPSEDNTVPRVHVCKTLSGCIAGYYNVVNDSINFKPIKKNNSLSIGSYKGGYYIYVIPFDYCLVPNNKLVFDSDLTGERWLVTYNEKTRYYPAICAGKLVVSAVHHIPRDNQTPIELVKLVLNTQMPLKLNDTISVANGSYEFIYSESNEGFISDFKKITDEEYNKTKQLSASMLSMESVSNIEVSKPVFSNW
jgi:hypothetical protein